MPSPIRLIMRSWFAVIAALALVGVPPATAGDRANIPLKNWGGFAVYRDSIYDDLERLATAGVADRVLLSTKPLSRIEAARMVATAIAIIRRDEAGQYNDRRDIEAVLDRLTREFRTELASLGVKGADDPAPAPGFLTFYPLDRAQVRAGYSSRDLRLIDSQGLRFHEGANGGATFESRAQLGDFATLYLQPEVLANEEFGALRLVTGYAKLTFFNVELLVGRDSLWWGPGLRGSLVFSSNASPLDQIRLGAAEPFQLPWVGKWVGPTKLLFFLAQLEEHRDHRRAKLAGMRATVAPFSFLEIGISRALMFDGDDRPRLDLEDYPRAIFYPASGDSRLREPQFRNNNVFAIDGDLRLRNVDRYYLPTRDLRLYGEFGWDDTCCDSNFIPLREAISRLIGIHAIGVLGQDGLEARLEYAETSGLSFTHDQFTDGYWTRGNVISHFIGTDGRDVYARVTNRLTPAVMLGLELDRAVIGSTIRGLGAVKERRTGGAIDLSYRFWDRYSLFGQYQVMDVENRNFKSGDNGIDHLFRLELTRSFR